MINISSTLEVNEAAPKIDENISVNDSGNKILRQNAKNMQQHDVYDKSNKVEHKVNDKTSFGELLQYVIANARNIAMSPEGEVLTPNVGFISQHEDITDCFNKLLINHQQLKESFITIRNQVI